MVQLLKNTSYDVAWQVLNSADFGVAQARKRVFIIGFLRTECSGRILSFTDANPKTLIQRILGKEGCRVYSPEGLSITLTGTAGGFGGKSRLYEILGLPIKSLTKAELHRLGVQEADGRYLHDFCKRRNARRVSYGVQVAE